LAAAGVERRLAVGGQHARARAEHHLGGALAAGERAVRPGVEGGHALALGGEGDLVHAGVLPVEIGLVQAGLGRRHHQRALGRVALDVPVALRLGAHDVGVGGERRRPQQPAQRGRGHPRRARERELAVRLVAGAPDLELLAGDQDAPRRHLVLGQRAGLVRADDRRAAQGLDGGQPPHERVAPRHALHADGQRDGDHGGQRLGHRGDAEGDAEDQHLDEGEPARQPEHDDARHHREAGPRQRGADAVEVLLQRRARGLHRLEQPGDAAEFGRHAGGHDQAAAAPVGGDRPGVGHVPAIAERQLRVGERAALLLDRLGLAGERGLVHLQVDDLDQARVGRQAVAGAQQHDVPGHQLPRRDLGLLAVAQGGGGGRGHAVQRLDGALGAELLRERQQHGEEQDGGDGHRLDFVAEDRGDGRGGDEDEDEDVLELLEQDPPRRDAAGGLQLVGAVRRQPPRRLGAGQSGGRRLLLREGRGLGERVRGQRRNGGGSGHGLLCRRPAPTAGPPRATLTYRARRGMRRASGPRGARLLGGRRTGPPGPGRRPAGHPGRAAPGEEAPCVS
jgi:hypothetical protein